MERFQGAVVCLTSARHQQRTACDAASARRFSCGLRATQVVPYTSGPAALRLARCLHGLQALSLHEDTSCLGGMTDAFAAGLAAHCPGLASLEVAFTRYSLPSETFTDAGMMALAEACPRLARLALTNCGAVTDRSLYAVASHCRGLRDLALGGYYELITDYGTVVLFQACTQLQRVVLGGKLRRVTDESAEAAAAHCGAALREVKLTRSMGDPALAALAIHCRVLRRVDCCKCEPGSVTAAGVASLLAALADRQQQQQPTAAAAALGATPSDICSGGGAVQLPAAAELRVLLPPGVAAAEVVRLGGGKGGGCGAAAAGRWSAISTQPPPSPHSMPHVAASSTITLLAAGTAAAASEKPGGGATTQCMGPGAAAQPYEEVVVRLQQEGGEQPRH